MASSRRRRSRRSRTPSYPRLVEPVRPLPAPVSYRFANLSGRTPRGTVKRTPRTAASAATKLRQLSADIRSRASARSFLNRSATYRQLSQLVEKLPRPGCKPRPSSRRAASAPRRRGSGAGLARAFIPWC